MTVEDEMAMHETQRWSPETLTLKQLVEEMIRSAYENGYEPEIKDMTDEELAQDIAYYLDGEFTLDSPYTEAEILAAVKEFRK